MSLGPLPQTRPCPQSTDRRVLTNLPGPVETIVGVFGHDVLQWVCAMRTAARRPTADQVHAHATYLLQELSASPDAQALPMQFVDDATFAIAALIDEVAMSLPDLRGLWSQQPLQAIRWMTNNAGVEVFERLARSRETPKKIMATYAVVLGLGFQGRFALPGANRYELAQLRSRLARELGVDPDRDWTSGVLRPLRPGDSSAMLPKEPFHKTITFARIVGISVLVLGLTAFVLVLVSGLR